MNTLKSAAVAIVVTVAALLAGCAPAGQDPHATMCLVGWDNDPEHVEQILAAAQEWHDATDGAVDLKFVAGHTCPDDSVPVERVPGMRTDDGAHVVGGTTSTSGYYIHLNPESERFYIATLHELGHYLIGDYHSDHAEDAMHWKTTNAQTGHLTARDVARFFAGE